MKPIFLADLSSNLDGMIDRAADDDEPVPDHPRRRQARRCSQFDYEA